MGFFFLKNLKYLLRKSVINNTFNKFRFIIDYKKIEENPINGIMPIIVKRKDLKIISASNQLIIKN